MLVRSAADDALAFDDRSGRDSVVIPSSTPLRMFGIVQGSGASRRTLGNAARN
jgi:hypothetical protein